MIKGMTGFGSSQFSSGEIKGTLEIKTVNHRYFDLTTYLPSNSGSMENKMRQEIKRHIDRGRITVSVKITRKPVSPVSFNKEVIRQYIKQAKSLRRQFKLKDELSLPDVVKLPGVIDTKDVSVNVEALWTTIERSLKTSLRSLVHMREREGKSLSADIKKKLKVMGAQVKKIKARAKIIFRNKKSKLTDEEFTSFQKNDDISEEISRLSHYIDEMRSLLSSNIAAGKKLDFIAQEMQRETNTIGSKLQDKIIANAVIALKSQVENIREQAQNIE